MIWQCRLISRWDLIKILKCTHNSWFELETSAYQLSLKHYLDRLHHSMWIWSLLYQIWSLDGDPGLGSALQRALRTGLVSNLLLCGEWSFSFKCTLRASRAEEYGAGFGRILTGIEDFLVVLVKGMLGLSLETPKSRSIVGLIWKKSRRMSLKLFSLQCLDHIQKDKVNKRTCKGQQKFRKDEGY